MFLFFVLQCTNSNFRKAGALFDENFLKVSSFLNRSRENNRSRKKKLQKRPQDYYHSNKLSLRAINKRLFQLKSDPKNLEYC